MRPKIPPYLTQDATIGIVAPARYLPVEYKAMIIAWFRERGWSLHFASNVFVRFNQFAGTDKERLHHLQTFLNDPDQKVIWCARGGYGTIRILSHLEWSHFKQYPKWIVGFSDITSLLIRVCLNGYCALHAPMLINLPHLMDMPQSPQSWEYTFQFLTGNLPVYRFETAAPVRKGRTEGILIGGNLSTLVNLVGTPFLAHLPFEETILFLEEVDEYYYHVDRMLWQLEFSGILRRIKGLILGSFSKMKDHTEPFGYLVHEMVLEKAEKYGYPVAFDLPFGHSYDNFPLLIGARIVYEVDERQVMLRFLEH